jgi:hypothetical protein
LSYNPKINDETAKSIELSPIFYSVISYNPNILEKLATNIIKNKEV